MSEKRDNVTRLREVNTSGGERTPHGSALLGGAGASQLAEGRSRAVYLTCRDVSGHRVGRSHSGAKTCVFTLPLDVSSAQSTFNSSEIRANGPLACVRCSGPIPLLRPVNPERDTVVALGALISMARWPVSDSAPKLMCGSSSELGGVSLVEYHPHCLHH